MMVFFRTRLGKISIWQKFLKRESRILRSQSTFQRLKLEKRFFPHDITSCRFDSDIAS